MTTWDDSGCCVIRYMCTSTRFIVWRVTRDMLVKCCYTDRTHPGPRHHCNRLLETLPKLCNGSAICIYCQERGCAVMGSTFGMRRKDCVLDLVSIR